MGTSSGAYELNHECARTRTSMYAVWSGSSILCSEARTRHHGETGERFQRVVISWNRLRVSPWCFHG